MRLGKPRLNCEISRFGGVSGGAGEGFVPGVGGFVHFCAFFGGSGSAAFLDFGRSGSGGLLDDESGGFELDAGGSFVVAGSVMRSSSGQHDNRRAGADEVKGTGRNGWEAMERKE